MAARGSNVHPVTVTFFSPLDCRKISCSVASVNKLLTLRSSDKSLFILTTLNLINLTLSRCRVSRAAEIIGKYQQNLWRELRKCNIRDRESLVECCRTLKFLVFNKNVDIKGGTSMENIFYSFISITLVCCVEKTRKHTKRLATHGRTGQQDTFYCNSTSRGFGNVTAVMCHMLIGFSLFRTTRKIILVNNFPNN